MADNIDYMARLKKARRRRKGYPRLPFLAAGVILVIILVAVLMHVCGRPETSDVANPAAEQSVEQPGEETTVEATASPEEIVVEQEEAKRQEVLDSYQNLGIVQVSGYLNVRETPSVDGKVIAKLQENSACEILETEGEWYHISSGGLDGYIHSQYVISGDEAREAAYPLVVRRAVIKADKLNIRREPVLDASNVVAQALENERYEVISEQEGWVQIPSGYVSADYVEVRYALNEARKLDAVTMALNQYDNLVISKVTNYLNVRSSPEDKGMDNVIGKFPSRAAGEILETEDGWYKIKSGSITGYVTSDSQYVAVGQEARDLAVQSVTLMAIVNTEALNVRSEPSTESSIWTQISKEDRYPVLDQLDGWVQIELDTGDEEAENKAFISTRDNNVDVNYVLAEAIKFSPLEEAANRSAALRNKVVNYALQFVGNRYVWGGTNPNTGADCSGFVQYVMRNAAGVSLPRTSREQAKTGRAITSGEMRPGDLIFYANSSGTVNHVAMYIGNGQIVHAASRRSGIRISTWNYRTPKYIRRFLD